MVPSRLRPAHELYFYPVGLHSPLSSSNVTAQGGDIATPLSSVDCRVSTPAALDSASGVNCLL